MFATGLVIFIILVLLELTTGLNNKGDVVKRFAGIMLLISFLLMAVSVVIFVCVHLP